jgi:hypothetical protein
LHTLKKFNVRNPHKRGARLRQFGASDLRPALHDTGNEFYRLHIQTGYVAHIVFHQMSDWDLALGVKASSSPFTSIYTVVNLYL